MIVGQLLGAALSFVIELEMDITAALNIVALLIDAAIPALDAPRGLRLSLPEHGYIHVLKHVLVVLETEVRPGVNREQRAAAFGLRIGDVPGEDRGILRQVLHLWGRRF